MNTRVTSDDELWEFYYDAMELVEIGDLPEAEVYNGRPILLT